MIYITEKQLAYQVGCSDRWLRELRYRGELKPDLCIGRKPRYKWINALEQLKKRNDKK